MTIYWCSCFSFCQNRCAGSPTVDRLQNNPSAIADSSGDCPRLCFKRKHCTDCLACSSIYQTLQCWRLVHTESLLNCDIWYANWFCMPTTHAAHEKFQNYKLRPVNCHEWFHSMAARFCPLLTLTRQTVDNCGEIFNQPASPVPFQLLFQKGATKIWWIGKSLKQYPTIVRVTSAILESTHLIYSYSCTYTRLRWGNTFLLINWDKYYNCE